MMNKNMRNLTDDISSRHWIRTLAAVVLGSVILSACGGGGGAGTTVTPNSTSSSSSSGGVSGGSSGDTTYAGPPPSTADVQAFRLNTWNNIRVSNSCGQCHNENTGQTPIFARSDDVNLAYNAAASLIDRNNPANSRLVTKVGGGHNCWLGNDAVCASTMTNYITAWLGGSSTNGNVVNLTAPVIKDVGNSKSFPASSAGFSPIHTLLTTHCVSCHTDTSNTPQTPYFANSDINAAYDVVKSKIDIETPANSRLVVRLRSEFHNCWTNNCTNDANQMQAAIQTFSDGIAPTVVDPSLVTSKALRVTDGIVASSGGRHETDVIALYEFKAGSGNTAFDTSPVSPAIHMTMSPTGVEWVGGWGVSIKDNGKLQGTSGASQKLRDRILNTGEYSIEAWVVPANVVQEDANIVSYSGSATSRNFTLAQTQYNYDFFQRSSTTSANGDPAHSTADADEDLQATLQHVVLTYDPANGRRIYVNGVFTDDTDATTSGSLSNWANNFALVFGNETSSDRDWTGTLRLVAIHERALTQDQITTNFQAGVGEKFFLLFNVSEHTGVSNSYVVLTVSQFDSYAYLFEKPFFISLDAGVTPTNVPLRKMRIGINGKEATVGQAYQNLDVTLDSSNYVAGSGQPISSAGTIIGLEKGTDSDEFFLTFEQLGSATNVVVEADPIAPATPPDQTIVANVGVRTFDEINASMSVLTGVSTTNSNVVSTYNTIKQALPVNEGVNSFLSSHQVALSQLAIEYCSELVDNTTLRASFFNDGSAFNFSASAGSIATSTWDTQVVKPLVDAVTQYNGVTEISSGPSRATTLAEIHALIVRMVGSGTSTTNVVKGSCAAMLGSAALLLQ